MIFITPLVGQAYTPSTKTQRLLKIFYLKIDEIESQTKLKQYDELFDKVIAKDFNDRATYVFVNAQKYLNF